MDPFHSINILLSLIPSTDPYPLSCLLTRTLASPSISIILCFHGCPARDPSQPRGWDHIKFPAFPIQLGALTAQQTLSLLFHARLWMFSTVLYLCLLPHSQRTIRLVLSRENRTLGRNSLSSLLATWELICGAFTFVSSHFSRNCVFCVLLIPFPPAWEACSVIDSTSSCVSSIFLFWLFSLTLKKTTP